MNNSFLDKQKEKTYDNIKYFIFKMISNILKICFSLAFILFLSFMFDKDIIDIIAITYTLLSIYMIYNNIEYYTFILNDIKNTLKLEKIYYEFNFNKKDNSLSEGLNYGK